MATQGGIGRIIGLSLLFGCSQTALAQLSATSIESLRQEGKARGWTFELAENPATSQPLNRLCGLVPPPDRQLRPMHSNVLLRQPVVGLPASFDWRTVSGCPPIRNQGGCGSCWAFATIGAVECAIQIKDSYTADLSEQWLINCNTYNYSCNGGWWAFDFLTNSADSCGKVGAMLESDVPYAGTDGSCVCAARTYRLSSWNEVNPYVNIPSVDEIKQAIMTYGPVAVAVYVDSTFSAYHGGIFNASASGTVNHAVVLVGWDDTQGTSGVWFVRNSWSTGWGESGYMRIAYGCSSIGYAAAYVDYPGAGIVTSVDQTTVTEGSTKNVQVHLMSPPSSNLTVSVARVSGDSDIDVSSGSSLTFTPSNWKVDQTVTLAAAEDGDNQNGQSTFRCSATGLQSHDVTVTEVDNDSLVIVKDLSAVTVSENSTANLRIKLSSAISSNTTVTCTRISGDTDVTVQSGSSLTFTSGNWSTYQTITFAAANDVDATNGNAIFRLSGSGLPNMDVVVTENDDDIISILPDTNSLTVAEGGTASFRVCLSGAPSGGGLVVSVARVSGDTDLSVQSGSSLSFTSSNWSSYQTVVVQAAADDDALSGQAVIRCSASGSPDADVTVTEQDSTPASLELDRSALTVLEGRTAAFGVRLGWLPTSNTTVVVAVSLGDADLSVASSSSLTFTTSNWNVYQMVTIAAAPDDDASNGQAVVQCVCVGVPVEELAVTEQDEDTLSLLVQADSAEVVEGSGTTLHVSLSAAPEGVLEVTTARVTGDTDLDVAAGAVLEFDASNWSTAQDVVVAAADDVDVVNGQAIFRCSADGLPAVDLTLGERETDVLAIELDRASISVPEGETATFAVRLSSQPTEDVTVQVARTAGDTDIAVTNGASLVFTSSNWNVYQDVVLTAADDDDLLDGTAAITCSATGVESVLLTAKEQDMEVSPAEVPGPTTTSGGGTIAAPGCGAGVGVAMLACCAVGLLGIGSRHKY